MPPAEAAPAYDPQEALLTLTAVMVEEGAGPVERVLPSDIAEFRQWDHHPKGDAIDPDSGARWFYHAHPPEDRGEEEHGHFHIFLPLEAFDGIEPIETPQKDDAAKVVHVAALAFDRDGLPVEWLATAHRVTMDHMMPGAEIAKRLDLLTLDRAGEKSSLEKVGQWLGLALESNRPALVDMLHRRDAALAAIADGEKPPEVLARTPFTID